MCSIAGIIDFRNSRDQRPAIKKMCDITSHRGPDGEGYFFFNFFNGKKQYTPSNIALGHRRLKIIDLTDKGDQPMSNEDSSIWLIQNGEIYNYIELRDELVAKGHIFRGNSDTEVIIHAYEEYGEDCLSRFNGIWGFALLDINKNILFCARDRLGEKPFFYYYDGNIFIFASEIKSILESRLITSQPNYKAIFSYLMREIGYTSNTGQTFFKGIKQLKASNYLILSDKGLIVKEYWRISFNEIRENDDRVYIDKFSALFKNAVKIRLRSDVPISSYLSGGLDTSSVVSVASSTFGKNRLTTFSSCFDDPLYDEREYIEEMVKQYGLEPIYVFPKPKKLMEELPSLIWHQEEPFLHLNVYAQWQIMSAIRDRGFKVVLNGHGGDEGLAGYGKDFAFYFADLLRPLKFKHYLSELGAFEGDLYNMPKRVLIMDSARIRFQDKVPNFFKQYLKRYTRLADSLDRDFYRNHAVRINLEDMPQGFLKRSSYMGYKLYPIPCWLQYEDRASMAHSVESRSPFLDHRLVEFMSSLPNELKIRGGMTKFVLRASMEGILPEKIRLRKDKKGFPTPSGSWFREGMKGYVENIINSNSFKKRNILNVQKVKRLFKEHCEGKKDLKFEIWSWINLELWMRKFFG